MRTYLCMCVCLGVCVRELRGRGACAWCVCTCVSRERCVCLGVCVRVFRGRGACAWCVCMCVRGEVRVLGCVCTCVSRRGVCLGSGVLTKAYVAQSNHQTIVSSNRLNLLGQVRPEMSRGYQPCLYLACSGNCKLYRSADVFFLFLFLLFFFFFFFFTPFYCRTCLFCSDFIEIREAILQLRVLFPKYYCGFKKNKKI